MDSYYAKRETQDVRTKGNQSTKTSRTHQLSYIRMKLKLIAYKTDYKIWAFDHEHNNTKNEALCNGTEIVLDWYFELLNNQKPIPGDKLNLQLATENELINPITELNLSNKNEFGSVYVDKFSGKKVWLCPWLQGYFGEVPDKIQILCEKHEEFTEIDDLIDDLIAEEKSL
jgi:hypothetical protein